MQAVQEKAARRGMPRRQPCPCRLSRSTSVADIAELKAARAALDYDDLILKARDLLRRPGIAPWVLYKLDGGIDHILVDEAQDTNHRQWDLDQGADRGVLRRHRRPATSGAPIFAVGDRKQSIFSFQGAEPGGRRRSARTITARCCRWTTGDDPRPPFLDVPLDVSFRSTGAVLKLVDAVIARTRATPACSRTARSCTIAPDASARRAGRTLAALRADGGRRPGALGRRRK